MKRRFFATPAAWRAWLARHHATSSELWVGFHKRHTGHKSITWPESVDEALCFGWIDGIRRSLGASSYMIRFTPRRAGSTWSAVNTRRALQLKKAGLMRSAGLRALADRRQSRSGIYAYEQRRKTARLPSALARTFKANAKAWRFFQSQPPWYRRTASWWIISAKQEETRARRLRILIADSARGRRIGPLTPPKASRRRSLV
jgi:uncharacterized protein YdeI (YjbR/CyaY-like superfamily)